MTGHSLDPSQMGMKRAEHDVTSGGTGQKKGGGNGHDSDVRVMERANRKKEQRRDGRRSSTDG